MPNTKTTKRKEVPEKDTENIRIPCAVCGVTFKKISYLKIHRKKYHKKVEEKATFEKKSENAAQTISVDTSEDESDWDVDPDISIQDDEDTERDEKESKGENSQESDDSDGSSLSESEVNVIGAKSEIKEQSEIEDKALMNKELETQKQSEAKDIMKGRLERLGTKPKIFVPKRKAFPLMEKSKEMYKKQKFDNTIKPEKRLPVDKQTNLPNVEKNVNKINIECEMAIEQDNTAVQDMSVKYGSKKVFQSFEKVKGRKYEREETINLGDYIPEDIKIEPRNIIVEEENVRGKMCI
ncbi:uncharacterized protein ZK546.14-like [Mercenaria mercenaria]|uniref:uncharacterized protein ZK546.14-like n=1 Tax=Mercenaria mercenaria TaxID=6596 RepID=UPI00234F53FB|nr:uncharacterized protein ZK546.14-like [Mercenaria mercenaria]